MNVLIIIDVDVKFSCTLIDSCINYAILRNSAAVNLAHSRVWSFESPLGLVRIGDLVLSTPLFVVSIKIVFGHTLSLKGSFDYFIYLNLMRSFPLNPPAHFDNLPITPIDIISMAIRKSLAINRYSIVNS